MTSLPGPQLVSLLSQGIHHDSTARDLHFLQGESRLSYHQSLLSQFSPLLKELLEDRLSLGLQEVTVLLDSSLDMASLNLLMDYLYTGQCVLKSRQQAASVLELAHLLQLDVSLQLPREDQQVLLHLPLEEEQSSLQLASPGNCLGIQNSNLDMRARKVKEVNLTWYILAVGIKQFITQNINSFSSVLLFCMRMLWGMSI